MRHVQKISRRKLVLLCVAIASLGGLAIVPWRVVAQDPTAPKQSPAAADPRAVPAPSEKAPAQTASTGAEKALAEKLIGAWRSGSGSGKLTFRADGTFNEFPNTLAQTFANASGVEFAALPNAFQGTWKVAGNVLELVWKCPLNTPGVRAGEVPPAVANGLPASNVTSKAQISRVDPTFLRLTMLDDQNKELFTLFFRRVEAQGLDTLKGKLPEELLKVAELAGMDAQEAQAADKWTKLYPQFYEKLKMLDRVAAAKAGKLSFAELLQLSPEEDRAYANLKKLLGGNISHAVSLANDQLLEEQEQKAVKRIEAFIKDFNSFSYSANSPNQPKYVSGNGGPSQMLVQGSPTETEASQKFCALLDELGEWLFNCEDSPLPSGTSVLNLAGAQGSELLGRVPAGHGPFGGGGLPAGRSSFGGGGGAGGGRGL